MGPPRDATGPPPDAPEAAPDAPGAEPDAGQSPSVQLAPLTPAGAAAALRGERLLPGGLAAAPDWPDEAVAPVLGMAAGADPDAGGVGHWLVVAAGTPAAPRGVVVGLCGVRARHPDGAVEIGYSLAPSARGHGLATAGVGALVRLLTGGPDPPDVVAETGADNRPSRRLLERLGFALEAGGARADGARADGGTGAAGRARPPASPGPPGDGEPGTVRYRLRRG